MDQVETDTDALSNDLMTGADAIGGFRGWSRRRTYNEANDERRRKTGCPVFRIGGVLQARKSKLRAWIASLEEAGINAA